MSNAFHKFSLISALTEEQELALVKEALDDKGLGGWPLLRSDSNAHKSIEDVLLSTGLSELLGYEVKEDETEEQDSLFLTVR